MNKMSRRKQARPIRHLDGDGDEADGGDEGQLQLTTVDGDQATGTSTSSLQLQDDGDDSSARATTTNISAARVASAGEFLLLL